MADANARDNNRVHANDNRYFTPRFDEQYFRRGPWQWGFISDGFEEYYQLLHPHSGVQLAGIIKPLVMEKMPGVRDPRIELSLRSLKDGRLRSTHKGLSLNAAMVWAERHGENYLRQERDLTVRTMAGHRERDASHLRILQEEESGRTSHKRAHWGARNDNERGRGRNR